MERSLPTLDDVDDIVTEAAVAEYWERGYWVSPRLFDDEQVQRLRAAHDRLWTGDHDYAIPPIYGFMAPADLASPVVRQQVDAFYFNAEMRRAILSPLIGKIAARLMQTDSVRLWHDQAIWKPGTGGRVATDAGNIGWHQDYGFWQSCSTTNMCSAWVALQDTDLSNGTMRMIVGSHKWGVIEGSNNDKKDMAQWAAHFASQGGGQWTEEPVILKAGEVSFHHALTFHGSGPNDSDSPRLCVVSHMMPGDTVYRAGRPQHPNLALLGPNAYDGMPFDSDFFPELWSAKSEQAQ
jgi:ectoine hydroxylase-related dioxygenase (phytanoyl-CoA dioxygenase family)